MLELQSLSTGAAKTVTRVGTICSTAFSALIMFARPSSADPFVNLHVLAMRHKSKILDGIVVFIKIGVMNFLSFAERTAKMLLHDKTMFAAIGPGRYQNLDIAIRLYRSSTLPPPYVMRYSPFCSTRARTKLRTSGSRIDRLGIERFVTLLAP